MITPELLAASGTEHGEQAALFCWAAMNLTRFPCLRWMHAIPNGGGRSMQQGMILKAEGVKPGICDIFLPTARCGYHGLYIEMKREDGKASDVKPVQQQFMNHVTMEGYMAVVCFGWKQAVLTLETYLAAA